MKTVQLTAIIEREGNGYVTLCPDVDVTLCPDVDVDVDVDVDLASQGASIDEARKNLVEALELFFETADQSEIKTRLHTGRSLESSSAHFWPSPGSFRSASAEAT
jgi:hypothetical protein